MAFGAISAITSLIPVITQMTQGAKQGRQAEELREQYPRPTYTTRPAITEAIQRQRGLAQQQRLPMQSMLESRLQEQQASTIDAIQRTGLDPASMLAAISGVNQQGIRGQQDIGFKAAEMQRQEEAGLINLLISALAPEQRKAFEYNQQLPYEEAAAAAGALQEASMRNRQEGLNSIASLAGQFGDTAIQGGMTANTVNKLMKELQEKKDGQDGGGSGFDINMFRQKYGLGGGSTMGGANTTPIGSGMTRFNPNQYDYLSDPALYNSINF